MAWQHHRLVSESIRFSGEMSKFKVIGVMILAMLGTVLSTLMCILVLLAIGSCATTPRPAYPDLIWADPETVIEGESE